MTPHPAVAPVGESCLVAATPVLARELRRSFDQQQFAQGSRFWEAAAVQSVEAWMRSLWNRCAMEDPQKTPVLLNSTQALDLWGSVILTQTTGDTRELLDVTASARAAMRAWELMRHWELPRQTEFWQGEDSRAFSQWATAFENELRAENWITGAELPRELATRIESGQLHLPGPILQAGFEEVAPAVARLISVCKAKIRAAEKVAPTKIQCAGCADVTDELEQAARWARSHLEQNPAARIGIFVCGLAPLTSAAERIFDDVLRPGSSFSLPDSAPVFSVARGANCGEVPILRTALAVLGLLTGVHRSEAGAIWNSPYLKISRERLSRAETRLRTEGQDLVTWRSPEIQACLPRFEKAAQSLQGDLRPSQWAAAFSRLLKQCDWPGERLLNSTEKSALDQWGEILGQLASLDLIHSALNQHQAYERLRQIARGAQLAPAALAINAPVQILDIEDAGGLRFDAIWLAGLHDGAWPAPPRPNPFLPLKLQFAARVRHSTAEWELEHARRVMQQLATAAPVIVASYPKAASEEQLRPSPLLEKLKTAKLQTGVGWMEEMAVACEEVEDTKGPPVTNHGVQQGGAHVLKNQAACPFRAFAVHRLGARSLDDAELGVSPRDHGNAAHKAMEMFWNEISSHQALTKHPDVPQLVLDCVDRALDQHTHKRSGTPTWFLEVERERLQRVMEAWIKFERIREPFTVVHSEQQQLIEIGGLRLEIRPDRIDRYEDGWYAVLDYKTGKIVTKDWWEGPRLDEPQLPLYALKLARDGNQVREIMLARLATGIKKQSDAALSQAGAELQANLIKWQQILENLAASFAAGEAAIAPKPPGKVCNQCDLGPICRIEKKRAEDDDNG